MPYSYSCPVDRQHPNDSKGTAADAPPFQGLALCARMRCNDFLTLTDSAHWGLRGARGAFKTSYFVQSYRSARLHGKPQDEMVPLVRTSQTAWNFLASTTRKAPLRKGFIQDFGRAAGHADLHRAAAREADR